MITAFLTRDREEFSRILQSVSSIDHLTGAGVCVTADGELFFHLICRTPGDTSHSISPGTMCILRGMVNEGCLYLRAIHRDERGSVMMTVEMNRRALHPAEEEAFRALAGIILARFGDALRERGSYSFSFFRGESSHTRLNWDMGGR